MTLLVAPSPQEHEDPPLCAAHPSQAQLADAHAHACPHDAFSGLAGEELEHADKERTNVRESKQRRRMSIPRMMTGLTIRNLPRPTVFSNT